MAAKAELELREVLLTMGLVQPVRVESKGSSVSAVCRVVGNQEKAWLRAVEHLLRVGQDQDVNFHLGTRFVLKDGVMVKGWDVAVEAKSGSDLRRSLEIFKTAAQTVVEMPPMAAAIPAPPAPAPSAKTEEDVDDALLEPPVDQEAIKRRAEAYAKHTRAGPRAPGFVGPNEPQQEILDMVPRVVSKGKARDQKNRLVPIIVEEVPLPYMHGVDDMNAPNEKDRGAKTIG